MTAAHDPMCPYLKPEQDRDPNDYCACDLIALARADERERIAQAIEEFHAAECGPPESPWPHVCTCVTAAAIARGEVLL